MKGAMRFVNVSIFALSFFLVFASKAQTNLISGYYVTLHRDTVRGYIDYRTEERNENICLFQSSPKSKLVKLYPEDILAYAVNDADFYESHTFTRKRNRTFLAFFRVVLHSDISLLKYQSRYFAEKKDSLYEITQAPRSNKMGLDFYGLGVMRVLLGDCDGVSDRDLRDAYLSSQFREIFARYNQCKGSAIRFSKKVTVKPHFDVGLRTSLLISKPQLGKYFNDAPFDENSSLGAGAFASVFLPRVNERMRIMVEAMYNHQNHYAYFTRSYTNNDLFITYNSLTFPLFLKYSAHRFYLEAGGLTQYLINQDLEWRIERRTQNSIYTSDGEVPPLTTVSAGYLVGMGLAWNISNHRTQLGVRYSDARMPYYPDNAVFRNLEFSLSFQITKSP